VVGLANGKASTAAARTTAYVPSSLMPGKHIAETVDHSMHIDIEILNKLARLARLEIEEGTEAQLMKDLNRILEWADQIAKPDLDEDMHAGAAGDAAQPLRADAPEPPLPRSTILRNAPQHRNGYITVPLRLNISNGYEE
jgi:aspartyl-tRNA(Asn)/glutamyl-tRNA(Gln) amidotransferase subunit C